MALLSSSKLNEILHDLGAPFSKLSNEKRRELRDNINRELKIYNTLRSDLHFKLTPHQRSVQWKKIEEATKKLLVLLRPGHLKGIEYYIERLIDPQAQALPNSCELKRELPELSDQELRSMQARKGMLSLSEGEVDRFSTPPIITEIKTSLVTLKMIAKKGQAIQTSRKSSIRRTDNSRNALIMELWYIYKNTFDLKTPSLNKYEKGAWPLFLSRTLSVLNGPISEEGAYKAFRKAKALHEPPQA